MLAQMNSPLESFATRLQALTPISGDDRAALLSLNGAIIQVAAGIDLVAPGAQGQYAHLVIEGLIGRFAQFSDGKRQITALYVPGDMAGLHALATPSVAPALQALTTTTLIRFPLHEMRAMVRTRPVLAEAFWAYCAVDTTVLARWAANLGRRGATQRMAHLLCEVGLRMEAAGRGERHDFEPGLTQPQLGDALGLTTVHVNRTLKALRTRQLVTVTGRRFVVHDWPELARLGDFDSEYLLLEETSRAA